MLSKFVFIILGSFVFLNCLYCDQSSDNRYKKEYDFIPIDALNIKVDRTPKGDFVSYYTPKLRDQKFFLSKEGVLIDFKEQIKSLLVSLTAELVNGIDFDESTTGYINITNINDKAQVAGNILYVLKDRKGNGYVPFFWSPNEYKLLSILSEIPYFCNPQFINNKGIIVGFDYKTYERTFYVGKSKKKKQILCREIVPVVWMNNSVKEICLFTDAKDEFSYLGNYVGRPNHLTIDDNNVIHFWFDQAQLQHAGSIRLSEID